MTISRSSAEQNDWKGRVWIEKMKNLTLSQDYLLLSAEWVDIKPRQKVEYINL